MGAHKAKGVRRQSLAGALASWLLMVAFIAIAAWQAVALAQVLANLTRSMAWQAVPAVVLNVELTSDSVKSTSPSVEDGIVFGAEGRYTYTYDGKPYTGHRLSFAQGQDNSAWHTSLWAELQSARAEGRTITVYVNPSDPQEAVYVRGTSMTEVVFMLLFVVFFGGVAAALAWDKGLLHGLLSRRRTARR